MTTVLTPMLTFEAGWIVATATAVATLDPASVAGGNLAIVVLDGVRVSVELSSLPQEAVVFGAIDSVS